jgi:hypothetical protein
MPTPDTIVGHDTDLLTQLFLKAPLPNLPHPRHLFQKEDINTVRAGVTHHQLIDCYHLVASSIKAGFGANVILSPSAWIRTMSDLITCMLQGVLMTRNCGPDGEPLDQNEFKNLLKEEDWEAVKQNVSNLKHLAQIFPPPLHLGEPPLLCSHCLHQTNLDARDRMTHADYLDALMATDCSRSAVMTHLMNHLAGDIESEIHCWRLDETTKW